MSSVRGDSDCAAPSPIPGLLSCQNERKEEDQEEESVVEVFSVSGRKEACSERAKDWRELMVARDCENSMVWMILLTLVTVERWAL